MTTSTSDRIERDIVLSAPRARVWQALTDAQQFGQWFGVIPSGVFAAGETITARVTIKGYEHVNFAITIVDITPQTHFAWRWHPHAIEAGKDYSSEPTTLVEFHLDEAPNGIRLRVIESGFDQIPLSRRMQAFRGNSDGWTMQMQNIAQYVGT